MVVQVIADLRAGVSQPRLESYRPAGGSDLDMIVTYFWNIALAEALYPGLAALEVILRSSIHSSFTAHAATDMWFRELLELGQLRDYAHAHVSLINRRKGAHPTSDQIVAERTSGFWTTLLSQPYHQRIWAPNRTAMVKMVFPHLPRLPNNRHTIHQRYNDLRFVRNRAMHHEPVWNGVRLPQRGVVALEVLHQEMIEAIGWISPTAQRAVDRLDRFTSVLNNRVQLQNDLSARLGI